MLACLRVAYDFRHVGVLGNLSFRTPARSVADVTCWQTKTTEDMKKGSRIVRIRIRSTCYRYRSVQFQRASRSSLSTDSLSGEPEASLQPAEETPRSGARLVPDGTPPDFWWYEAQRVKGEQVQMKNLFAYLGLRNLALLFILWLATGTAFYFYTGFEAPHGAHNLVAALYFTVNSGFSVGSGPVVPASEIGSTFAQLLCLSGTGIVITSFLSLLDYSLDNQISVPAPWNTVVMEDESILHRVNAFIKEEQPFFLCATSQLMWLATGTAFAHYEWNWGWLKSLNFALSFMSTTGLQSPPDSTSALAFSTLFALVAVPLTTLTVGEVVVLFVKPMVVHRRQKIRFRAIEHAKQMAPVQCDGNTCWVDVDGLGRMFELYDTDRSQKLDQTELRQMMQKITPSHINVTEEDIHFWLFEMDEDLTGEITKGEFIKGMERWMLAHTDEVNKRSKTDLKSPRKKIN